MIMSTHPSSVVPDIGYRESILLFLQRRGQKTWTPDEERRLRAGASWQRRGDDRQRVFMILPILFFRESDSV